MPLKRRDFLKIGGTASLLWPLAKCSLDRLPDSPLKSDWFSAEETWIPTTCGACEGGCGLMVRKIDGRAVKVEGNPLHPLNRGKVCSRGQAGMQLLYNPDRIRTPLRKEGGRASGSWKEITWEEGLSLLSEKLLELRRSGRAQALAYLGPGGRSASQDLLLRFLQVYGSTRVIAFDPWRVQRMAYAESHGFSDLLAPDFEHCRTLLSFGADFLINGPDVMAAQRFYGQKRSDRSFSIIQVEPRFSLTASRADRWIPINPGTEGLLALGLASVILREQLYDEAFVDRFCSRFAEFKSEVLDQIRIERISDVTGVSLPTIIETAKKFALSKPSLALCGPGLTFQSQGLFHALAVHALNALSGSIDVPGGMVRQRPAPLRDLPPARLDEVAKKALSSGVVPDGKEDSVKNLLGGRPEIQCLLVSSRSLRSNFPFFTGLEEACRKVPFIVSFSPYMNETPQCADLVLPDTTYFEKWRLSNASPLSKTAFVGLGQPVIDPLYDNRPFDDVLLSLARRMGEPFASNFPWKDNKEVLSYRLSGLQESMRGTVFLPPEEEAQLKTLEERGWWTSPPAGPESFLQILLERGGWQDPVYHYRMRSNMFQTPDRRFSFFSPGKTIGSLLASSSPDAAFPLRLYLYDLPLTLEDSGAHMPSYQETLGFPFGYEWRWWVEIGPAAAEESGIREGDNVWVESSHGRIPCLAKIFQGLAPGVAAMPLGKEKGFPPGAGREGRVTPLDLLGGEGDVQTGAISRLTARVRIYKSGGTDR